jgi:hypothetical protein
MINVRVSGDNFDDILQLIHRIEFPDLTPLVEPLKQIMIDDNRDGLLASTDSYGDRMTELSPNTWLTRKGSGPPLAPDYGSSPIITDYRVDPEDMGPLHVRLVGTWPSLHWVHFHVTGFRVRDKDGHWIPVVSRDPTGIRPASLPKIEAALETFAIELIGG